MLEREWGKTTTRVRVVTTGGKTGLFRPVVIISALFILAAYLPAITSRAMTPEEVSLQNQRIGWTSAVDSHHIAMDIAYRVNEERKARGLLPLVWHEGLADLARDWSEDMMVNGYRHSPGEYRMLPDLHGIGENILMGFNDSGDAHLGWMESDGHRRNIMMPEFTAIGIGVVCRNDGLIWATQLLAMPNDVYPVGQPEMPPADPIVRPDAGYTCS